MTAPRMKSAPRIVVVGSVNVDLVTRSARLPLPGETQRGTGFAMTLGGKGANQAIAAARLGAEVSLIGCVGSDAFADFARRELGRQAGLSLEGLSAVEGISTGIATIAIDSAGQNAITIIGGANDALTPALVERHRAAIERADVLMIQGEVPDSANVAAARLMRGKGGTVVFDPAPVREGGFSAELLALTDVLTPNETEAGQLTGVPVVVTTGATDAPMQVGALGPAHVVLKLGAHGAMHFERGKDVARVPPFRVRAIDTVAAGDSFNAGLAVGLAERIGWRQALRLASAAGALATTRAGASAAAPRLAEVQALLDAPEQAGFGA